MTPGLTHTRMASDIWSVADLLRGDFKRHEYGRVILPFTLLRRLDAAGPPVREAAGPRFATAAAQPDPAVALRDYLNGFAPDVRQILACFDFGEQLTRLAEAGLLAAVAQRFAALDGLARLSGHDMGFVFEHLIRRFAEDSHETAGEHFTPREVVALMVNLLTAPDTGRPCGPGQLLRVLDPACGTGGMLAAAADHLAAIHPDAEVHLSGQEVNAESWAVCQADMLLRGQRAHIQLGNSLTADGFGGQTFGYMLANPPFGVEWRKARAAVEAEARLGPAGRFGAGTPRISDGSLLFLQHMLAKMAPAGDGGSRLAIVLNGSPLFTGGAGSGESGIRRWILENDWLEGIVALPDQLFSNTGIATYLWILSNRKDQALRGQVILLDAREQWERMPRSLGDKRKWISGARIQHITQLYTGALAIAADPGHPDHAAVRVRPAREFGYRRITVERPLRLRFAVTADTLAALAAAPAVTGWDGAAALTAALRGAAGTVWPGKQAASRALRALTGPAGLPWPLPAPVRVALWAAVAVPDPGGEVQRGRDGQPRPDPDLRDHENIPLGTDPDDYLARAVLPHVPDAWIDHSRTRTGYEIPFARYFHRYVPPRPLAEIDADLRDLEDRIGLLLGQVTG